MIPFWNYKLPLLLDPKTTTLPEVYKAHLLRQLSNYRDNLTKVTLLLPPMWNIVELIDLLAVFQDLRLEPPSSVVPKQELVIEICSIGLKTLELIQVRFAQSKNADIKQALATTIFNDLGFCSSKEHMALFEQLFNELDGVSVLKLLDKFPRGVSRHKQADLENFFETLKTLKVNKESISQVKLFLQSKEQKNFMYSPIQC